MVAACKSGTHVKVTPAGYQTTLVPGILVPTTPQQTRARMGGDDTGSPSVGPSSVTMAPPVSSAHPPVDYNAYWQSANRAAEPAQSSIRRRLPHFPSPPLRIQRVSQLDAEILDSELTSMLLEPVKMSLRNIKSTLPLTMEPEMLLVLRLILYKFSIYERGATYGAMLQNLRYRNEWAHSGGLQSTSRDASLSRIQLTLYPALTIVFPYLHNKLEQRMSHLSYSEMQPNDPRRLVWSVMDQLQRVHAALSLANFLAFLNNGRYRTLTDRALGMRLTYAERTMNRNVSFEFLNRQLVWHAFTEFLLFLLPLVRPRKLLRRLLRIPQHPLLLSFWLTVLPKFLSSKAGLYRDEKGTARIKLPFGASKALTGGAGGGDASAAKYPDLPDGVCAICWERLEDEAGIKSSGQSMIRAGIPSSDPLDPSSSALAPSTRAQHSASPATKASSSSGLVYADAQVHTAYQADPCGHVYCYVCLAGKLLSEEAAEEMAETAEERDEGGAAWRCLRCAKGVRSARREQDDVVLEATKEDDGNEAQVIAR